MATYLPLVILSGTTTELPPGDTAVGLTLGSVSAGSGLSGGGSVSAPVRLDVALASNPSGLQIVANKLGDDGVAYRTALQALNSGGAAISNLNSATASGEDSVLLSSRAIASGNAVYPILASTASEGVTRSFTASSPIISGSPVGLDDSGRVQTIRFYRDALALTNGNTGNTVFTPFASGQIELQKISYQSDQDAYLVSYKNTANTFGYSQVVRVVGNSITAGPLTVFKSAAVTYINSVYSPVDKRIVLAYDDTVQTANISGTNVTFGAGSLFAGAAVTVGVRDICLHERDTTIVFVYNVGSRVRASVGKIVGSSVTLGSVNVPASDDFIGSSISCSYNNAAERVYVAYPDFYTVDGKGLLVNTSGTTFLGYTSSTQFGGVNTSSIDTSYDVAQDKLLTVYNSDNLYPYGTKLVVGTVSGGLVNYGPALSISSRGLVLTPSLIYDPVYQRNLFSYRANNTYETAREPIDLSVFTLSGFYIGDSSRLEALGCNNINGSWPQNPALAIDGSGNAVVVATTFGGTYSGVAWTLKTPERIAPTFNYYNNYLGVAQNTATSGSAVTVRLPGSIDASVSNISTGFNYYLSPATSGFTTNPNRPAAWSGLFPWDSVAKGAGTNRLLLTDSL